MEPARREPIAQARPGALWPWLDPLDRNLLVIVELVGGERDRTGADEHVIHEDELVKAIERVDSDERAESRVEPKLFLHLAQSAFSRRLARFQEPGHEAEPVRRPADAMHEHDATRALDNRGDDRHRVAPVHEATRGTSEPLEPAVLTRLELGAA